MTYKRYEKYKDSHEEWIGIVPETWQVEPIREFYDYRSEKVSDKVYEPLSVTKQGILPQLEHAAKTDNNDNRKKVKKGDFVINSRSDRKGSCGVSPYEGSVSLIYHVLSSKDPSINAYAHHLFRSVMFAEEFYKWGHGIVDDLWSTRWEEMKKIKIPMPPKEERIAIGRYLNKKIENLDEQLITNKRLVELLEEKRVALINQVVTKGLNPDVVMKDSGVDWIGEIPEHWDINPLKSVANIIMGQSPDSNDINDEHEGFLFMQGNADFTNKYPNPSEYCIAPKKISREGDILMSVRAPVGELNISDKRYGIGRGLCSIKPINVTQSFLWYYLLKSKSDFNYYSNGSTFDAITIGNLSSFPITIPKLNEQKQIGNYLNKETSKIEKIIEKITMNIKLLEEYKTSLIHHVVTGKIDVREEVV